MRERHDGLDRQSVWDPKNLEEWTMWAIARLVARGEREPVASQLIRELDEHFRLHPDQSIFHKGARKIKSSPQEQIRNAKAWVLEHGKKTPVEVWREVENLRQPERLADALERVLRDCRSRYATENAEELSRVCGRDIFTGNLLHYTSYPPGYRLGGGEVETVFFPKWFPHVGPDNPQLDELRQSIQNRIDGELREEIDRFLVEARREEQTDRRALGLGSNNLRALVERITPYTEDHVGNKSESNVRPLRLVIGAMDWYRIEGFNNRLFDDDAFRRDAHEKGWTRSAIPPNTGVVPNYVAALVVVTGEDRSATGPVPYLVLTQRLPKERTRYSPDTWSITIEENMQGPRWVNRDGIKSPERADRSLHHCAYRGLAEELGVEAWDVESVLLLGMFVEAPSCAMVGIFWAHLCITWEALRARVGMARDREARVVAKEPLSTRNLVELFVRGRYQPRRDEERDYFAPDGVTTTEEAFHPGSRPRLLAYLLADTRRHPLEKVVDEFQKVGHGSA
jgi:hypothetical protein